MQKGLIHVYYGDGKGKTTAACGLALRFLGWGKRVMLLQFLKSRASGEVEALKRFPNLSLLRGQAGEGFYSFMGEEDKALTRRIHRDNLKKALDSAAGLDLLILDECLDAYALDCIDKELLTKLLLNKPPHMELVITGHAPVPWIMDKADYITHMESLRHPYEKGISAREGAEY